KDIKLYELLAKEKHMSPFEHQATCFPEYLLENNFRKFHKNEYRQHGVTHCSIDDKLWSGNFREFAQYRQIFDYQSFINNSKEINTETKGFDLNNVF
nr:hypothetical protein [Candidatus Dadabacteria bacterium]